MPSSLRHAEEALRQELNPAAMPLVSFAGTVEEAVREADLAIDCVPDELESKLEIFSLMDRMARRAPSLRRLPLISPSLIWPAVLTAPANASAWPSTLRSSRSTPKAPSPSASQPHHR